MTENNIIPQNETISKNQKYLKPIRYFPGTHARSLIDFSSDGNFALITANSMDNPDLLIWNVTNSILSSLSSMANGLINLGYMGHGRIWSMAISNHGDLAMAGYDTYDILCWDVKNNQIVCRHMRGWNSEPIEYLKFFPDDEQCIVSYDYGIFIIDARSGKTLQPICSNTGETELLKDGTKLRVRERGNMMLYDLQNKWEPKIYQNAVHIEAMSMFPNQEKFVTINSDGLITIWDETNGVVISQWFHRNPPLLYEVNSKIPQEQWGLFFLDPAYQELFKQSTYSLSNFMRCERKSIDISADGTKILSGGGDNTMRLWTLEGQVIYEYPHPTHVIKVAFLPDGEHALSGCFDGSVYLWELPGHVIG